jgi:two-component system chemotaxis response regulator CheY
MLIIDDSSTMRSLLGMIASELGVESEQAPDGQAALDRVQRSPDFDVALVDWDMPRMNGLEFVRAVRARPAWGGMKLMMVTSRHVAKDVQLALTLGADDFLMKPLDAGMLADKLRLLGLLE